MIDTNYFLVGGFHIGKNMGIIKLYKVNYSKETKIEYIQVIIINREDNFKGFKGPISCITQTIKDEIIIVTCWDGNVILLDMTNIDYDIDNDNKLSLNEFFGINN